MQAVEMSDSKNEPDMEKSSGDQKPAGRKFSWQLIVLGFGLLCIVLVVFTCAPHLTQLHAPSQRCPPGWREIESRCYFLSNEHKTWEDSREYCQRHGADLVVINSEREQRAIYRLDGDQYLLFWVGLKNTNGVFRWVDGSALTKPFWKAGQPGDGGPNNVEDCVEMYHHDPVLGNWNDAPCGHARRWLCETAICK